MTSLAYVNGVAAGSDASATSIASPSWSLAAGNHVFVWVSYATSTTTISLADTAGNTYTALAESSSGTTFGRWFYKLGAAGNAANVITATFGAARTFLSIRAAAISGTSPTGVTQLSAGNGATAATSVNTADAGSVTVGAGGMVVAASAENSASDTAWAFADSDGGTFTNAGATYAHAALAYQALATGIRDRYVTFTGTASAGARLVNTLMLDIGGSVPAADTKARTSQVATETLRTNGGVVARSSQIAVEVIRPNTGVLAIISQTAIEVLRPNAAVVMNSRPQVCVCT